jgi:hypothetical protein
LRQFSGIPAPLDAASQQWFNNATQEQRDAVRYWSENGYKEFQALGRGQPLSAFSTAARAQSHFVDALETAPRHTGWAWRGVSIEGDAQTILDHWQRSVGATVNWDTYSSASLSAETAGGFARVRAGENVLFEVYSKSGRYINPATQYAGKQDDEYELIFMPNTTFAVRAVYQGRFDSWKGPQDAIIVVLEES